MANLQTEGLQEGIKKGGDTVREGIGEFPKIEISEEDEKELQKLLKDIEEESNGEQEKQQ